VFFAKYLGGQSMSTASHCISTSQLSAPKDVTSFLAIKEMTNTTRDMTDEAGWMSSMGSLRDKNESTHTKYQSS